MQVIERIKKINNRLGRKLELRPGNIGEVLSSNFFETSDFSTDYHSV